MIEFYKNTTGLYNKAIREARRAYLTKNHADCNDHVFNFCVTIHSLRDWSIKEFSLNKGDFHSRCNKIDHLRWCRDIANGSKHLELDDPDKGSIDSVESTLDGRVTLDPYGVIGELSNHPSVTINIKNEGGTDLLMFLFKSLECWNNILKDLGVSGNDEFAHFAIQRG
jgi:hypothetical protein